MKTLVVVPTYNEVANIQLIIPEILKNLPTAHILVVDDGSPDGTGPVVLKISQSDARVHLLQRTEKNGLGRAYLAGFAWALQKDYEAIVEMDADFSHRPQDLPKVVAGLQNADFAVGSRYIAGGGTQNWGLLRKLISRGGGIYSRFILGFPLNDWTGGFNAWTREVLMSFNLDKIKSNGYSFQIELKYRALCKNFKGVEVPILFEERRLGQSKMSLAIVVEAFWKVVYLRRLIERPRLK